MPSETKRPAAILVKPENRFGTRYLLALLCETEEEENAALPSGKETVPMTPEHVGKFYCQNGELMISAFRSDFGATLIGGDTVSYADLHCIDAYRAAMVSKTLHTISAKLAKLADQRGYASGYAEHIMRFGEACGVKSYLIAVAALPPKQRPSNAGKRWLEVEPRSARLYLEACEQQCVAPVDGDGSPLTRD